MPDNTYTAKTRLLAPVPRSKRMRDANVTVAQQQSAQQPTAEQTWTRDTASVQGVEVLVPVAEPLVEVLRLRNGSHIVTINVDSNGYLHVDSGMYSDSFVSALGLNPDAPTPGGGGLDEDELWQILGGSSTNHHILPTYLDSVPWSSVTGVSVTNAQLAGSIANAKLANSSVTIAGVSVSLGGSITQASLRTALGLGSNAYTSTAYLPTGGGTMTGNLVISESKNILLRTNTSYTAGIGYDTAGNECIALWAKNSVTRLRWYAGVDMTNLPFGTMMNITPDFEISKADGSAKGYIASNTILHSGNYSSFCLPLTGGTMTGVLHLKADQYNGVTAHGMNCHNSDIVNVNSILTADTADSFGEGICFYRSGSGASATWDCLSANGGTFYFGSNKTYGAALSGDANINCGSIKLTNNGGIIVNSENKVILHSNTTDKYTLLNFEGAASQYVTYIDGYDIRFRYGTGHAEGIRLTNAGNVGIGTSSPTEFLHLYKPSAVQNVALFQNSNANVLCGIESDGNGIFWNRNNNYIRFGTNATERMRILANGSIAIAQTETTTALDVYGTIRSRAFNANGRSHASFVWDKAGSNLTGVGSNDETDTIYFGACDAAGTWVSYSQLWKFGGSIYATGDITAGADSSDWRLKKDIKQFNAMSIVDALRPIQFRWNNVAKGLDKYFDTDEIQYGLIAQECDKAMPGLAFKFKANDYYGVRYEKLIPVLLEAIKELKAEINQIKSVA